MTPTIDILSDLFRFRDYLEKKKLTNPKFKKSFKEKDNEIDLSILKTINNELQTWENSPDKKDLSIPSKVAEIVKFFYNGTYSLEWQQYETNIKAQHDCFNSIIKFVRDNCDEYHLFDIIVSFDPEIINDQNEEIFYDNIDINNTKPDNVLTTFLKKFKNNQVLDFIPKIIFKDKKDDKQYYDFIIYFLKYKEKLIPIEHALNWYNKICARSGYITERGERINNVEKKTKNQTADHLYNLLKSKLSNALASPDPLEIIKYFLETLSQFSDQTKIDPIITSQVLKFFWLQQTHFGAALQKLVETYLNIQSSVETTNDLNLETAIKALETLANKYRIIKPADSIKNLFNHFLENFIVLIDYLQFNLYKEVCKNKEVSEEEIIISSPPNKEESPLMQLAGLSVSIDFSEKNNITFDTKFLSQANDSLLKYLVINQCVIKLDSLMKNLKMKDNPNKLKDDNKSLEGCIRLLSFSIKNGFLEKLVDIHLTALNCHPDLEIKKFLILNLIKPVEHNFQNNQKSIIDFQNDIIKLTHHPLTQLKFSLQMIAFNNRLPDSLKTSSSLVTQQETIQKLCIESYNSNIAVKPYTVKDIPEAKDIEALPKSQYLNINLFIFTPAIDKLANSDNLDKQIDYKICKILLDEILKWKSAASDYKSQTLPQNVASILANILNGNYELILGYNDFSKTDFYKDLQTIVDFTIKHCSIEVLFQTFQAYNHEFEKTYNRAFEHYSNNTQKNYTESIRTLKEMFNNWLEKISTSILKHIPQDKILTLYLQVSFKNKDYHYKFYFKFVQNLIEKFKPPIPISTIISTVNQICISGSSYSNQSFSITEGFDARTLSPINNDDSKLFEYQTGVALASLLSLYLKAHFSESVDNLNQIKFIFDIAVELATNKTLRDDIIYAIMQFMFDNHGHIGSILNNFEYKLFNEKGKQLTNTINLIEKLKEFLALPPSRQLIAGRDFYFDFFIEYIDNLKFKFFKLTFVADEFTEKYKSSENDRRLRNYKIAGYQNQLDKKDLETHVKFLTEPRLYELLFKGNYHAEFPAYLTKDEKIDYKLEALISYSQVFVSSIEQSDLEIDCLNKIKSLAVSKEDGLLKNLIVAVISQAEVIDIGYFLQADSLKDTQKYLLEKLIDENTTLHPVPLAKIKIIRLLMQFNINLLSLNAQNSSSKYRKNADLLLEYNSLLKSDSLINDLEKLCKSCHLNLYEKNKVNITEIKDNKDSKEKNVQKDSTSSTQLSSNNLNINNSNSGNVEEQNKKQQENVLEQQKQITPPNSNSNNNSITQKVSNMSDISLGLENYDNRFTPDNMSTISTPNFTPLQEFDEYKLNLSEKYPENLTINNTQTPRPAFSPEYKEDSNNENQADSQEIQSITILSPESSLNSSNINNSNNANNAKPNENKQETLPEKKKITPPNPNSNDKSLEQEILNKKNILEETVTENATPPLSGSSTPTNFPEVTNTPSPVLDLHSTFITPQSNEQQIKFFQTLLLQNNQIMLESNQTTQKFMQIIDQLIKTNKELMDENRQQFPLKQSNINNLDVPTQSSSNLTQSENAPGNDLLNQNSQKNQTPSKTDDSQSTTEPTNKNTQANNQPTLGGTIYNWFNELFRETTETPNPSTEKERPKDFQH